jgi:selenium-binding protein 1
MADEHHHDPTFYRSPRDAAAGPPEKLAYVAAFSPAGDRPDAIAVVDTDPASGSYALGRGLHRAAPHR